MIEYVLNLHTGRLHIRRDGATMESCNVDQIRKQSITTTLPEGGKRSWFYCSKCRHLSAGVSPEGVAP